MAISNKHILHQGPVIATWAGTAWSALRQQIGHSKPAGLPSLPTAELTAVVGPRNPQLVRDYIRHTGGDPAAYKGFVPPHLFPQWSFPLSAKAVAGLPYPLVRVVNGGCRLELNHPLPADQPLHVRVCIEDIDDNGRRAVIHQRVITETPTAPEAVVAHIYAIVPTNAAIGADKSTKAKSHGSDGGAGKRALVPAQAEELARWKLGPQAGLDFAKLTGDFNPVHWIRSYAKAFGFRSTILHGFATMARAIEGLQRTVFAGSVHALQTVDVKFTNPLTLPAKVGLYIADHSLFVGDAPGGPAYLVGEFDRKAGVPS